MMRAMGGRLTALLLATGLMLCVSAPLRANDVQADDNDTRATEQVAQAEPGKPVALGKYTKRKRERTAKAPRVQKPRVVAKGYRRKAIEADTASNAVPINEAEQPAMTDAVSNANAQWPAVDTNIQSVTTAPKPNVSASDQLSETDKALNAAPTGDDAASQIASKMTTQLAQNPSQAAGVNVPTTASPASSSPAMSAMASADRPEASSRDDNAWSQSSLIGKIFIAFGGLLTMASAARMFMA